jgi:hypothetical protein
MLIGSESRKERYVCKLRCLELSLSSTYLVRREEDNQSTKKIAKHLRQLTPSIKSSVSQLW